MQTEDLFGTPHPTGIGARSGAVETRVPVAELLNKVLELARPTCTWPPAPSRRCGSTEHSGSSRTTRC
jgi:hypothetical protein